MKKESTKNTVTYRAYGVGIASNKHPVKINGEYTKEYTAWHSMLERCFSEAEKKRYYKYRNTTCCDEWLEYDSFYEWLHSQSNFDKWLNNKKWDIDKDILIKNNNIYSPETCCLIPHYVNLLFTKSDSIRGELPIGVQKRGKRFTAIISKRCNSNDSRYTDSGRYRENLGIYDTPEEAFRAYKKAKESHIKQVAREEYENGNITKQCYEAMMRYEVEITD